MNKTTDNTNHLQEQINLNLDNLDDLIEPIEIPNIDLPDTDPVDLGRPESDLLNLDGIDFSILGEDHLALHSGLVEFVAADISTLTRLSIGAYKGKLYYLDRWGFRPGKTTGDPDLLPQPAAVEQARLWFRDHAAPGSIINTDYNSYTLGAPASRKADTENPDRCHIVIAPGDVILAAILEGIEVVPTSQPKGAPNTDPGGFSRNAYFKIDLPTDYQGKVDAYLVEGPAAGASWPFSDDGPDKQNAVV